METPKEKNFSDYKKAEAKALELLEEMKKATPKPVDIELAFLVAIFELHKRSLPAPQIAKIVDGHLNELVSFYSRSNQNN